MTIYALEEFAPVCDPESWIADNAAVIGCVELLAGASVWFGVVIRAESTKVTVGERSNIQDLSVLHNDPGIHLKIGRDVTIGHRVILHGCEIGDGSLVGMGAIIMNHAKIGSGCIVGAGSLIPEGKVFPDRSLILGSPAKVVRELTETEIANNLRSADIYYRRWQLYATALRRQVTGNR